MQGLASAMVTVTTSPAQQSGTDWTEIGVLLTAGFTGGIVLFTGLAYWLAYRESSARTSVLYKFPLVEIFQQWLFSGEGKIGFQLRLIFQNTHDAPLGYQMENLRLQVGNDSWRDAMPAVGTS